MTRAPYSSPLAEQLAPDVLHRFLTYVRIDTQSRRDRTSAPSTRGQRELGELLVSELREAGVRDAELDANGYVMASLEPTGEGAGAPAVGLIAHLDTTPDVSGHGVQPIVHRRYAGGVIALPRCGTRLDPGPMPELAGRAGHDIVTASGDTLLGADDKAGIAAIMAAIAHLRAHPELPRAPLRIAFTPDEEIGEGATLFDIERFGAACAYTVDGGGLGEIQEESFSALEAILTVHGVDVHPGDANGKLVSALRLAARIVAALPAELAPERAAGRQGFIHPYELSGTPSLARVRAIVRDFDDDRLQAHAALLRRLAEEVVATEPRAELELDLRRQYSNMRRYLEAFPEVGAAAREAVRAEGLEPVMTPIRGGTDGSRLSEMGLPTPNLFTGGHEHHSVREWASVQEMAAAAATIVRLAEVWTRPAYRRAAPARARP